MSKSPEQRARTNAHDLLKAASAALLEQFSSGISNSPKKTEQPPGTEAKTQGQYTPSVMATDETKHPPSDGEAMINGFICTVVQNSSVLFGVTWRTGQLTALALNLER